MLNIGQSIQKKKLTDTNNSMIIEIESQIKWLEKELLGLKQ